MSAVAVALMIAGCAWFLPGEDPTLVVRIVLPVDGDTEVPVDSEIWVNLSAQIDVSSVTDSTITVEHIPGAPVSGTTVAFGGDVTFTPDAALDYDTTYTVTLAGSLSATNGASLAEPYTWSFTTEPAPG